MPTAYTRRVSRLTIVATALAVLAAGQPAWAGKRAPIVYASGGEPAAAPVAAPSGKPVDKASQRIEFRYPGDASPAALLQPQRAGQAVSAVAQPGYSPGAFIVPSFAAAAAPVAPVVETAALQPLMPVKAAPVAAETWAGTAEQATAIVYDDEYDGLPTASGEILDQNALMAAHPTLPLPSMVTVSNPANGKEIVVRVNDRGPFEDGATLQVTRQAARELGFEGTGQAELTLRTAGSAPAKAPAVRLEPKSVIPASRRAAPAGDELLGGDELAGGVAQPVKARADVKWPEPPADWGVKPASVKTSTSVPGALYVQLGSFSDIGNAEKLSRNIGSNLPVEIAPARVNGADFFRVRVGPLADRDTAQTLRDLLEADGKGSGRVVTAD